MHVLAVMLQIMVDRQWWDHTTAAAAAAARMIYPADMQGLDAKCSGTVKMLIDLELLAHTHYLVASDHSRWSQVLQYMRYILYGAPSDPEPPDSAPKLGSNGALVLCSRAADACQVSGMHQSYHCHFSLLPERSQSGMLLIPTRRNT